MHKFKFVAHSGELAKGPGFHFTRQIASMEFHRSLADAKVCSNLLANAAAHDVNQDFTFPRGQGFEAFTKVTQGRLFLAPGVIFLEA